MSARNLIPLATPRPIALASRPAVAVAATLTASFSFGAALVVGAASQPASDATALLRWSCWLLVLGGVTGTFLAGSGRRSGWLVLLGMQPVWIAYAIATGQYGFVAGSLAYAGAQLHGYLRACAATNGDS